MDMETDTRTIAKKVLLVTDGIFHPTFFGRMALHNALKQMEVFSFEHISSLEKLPANPGSFSALVLHFHHKIISAEALNRLDSFTRNGGGILAIHAATASFKQTPSYFKILGGRFVVHGKVEKFQVEKFEGLKSNDVFAGINDFVVKDELYIHELQSDIEVHFTAKHEGKDIPVVWTHRCGTGKICYAVPGHTTGTMRNKTYQQILKRGLKWICK